MKTIEELRQEIDNIDIEIKKLLEKRFETSTEVGIIKAASNRRIFDGVREQQIISAINSDISLNYKYEISNIYKEIFKLSRVLQSKIVDVRKNDGI